MTTIEDLYPNFCLWCYGKCSWKHNRKYCSNACRQKHYRRLKQMTEDEQGVRMTIGEYIRKLQQNCNT